MRFLTLNSSNLSPPYSLDFSRWYTSRVVAILIAYVLTAAWAFYTSLGGQKLWKDELFE